jgi:hypothetical protein
VEALLDFLIERFPRVSLSITRTSHEFRVDWEVQKGSTIHQASRTYLQSEMPSKRGWFLKVIKAAKRLKTE